STSEKTLLDGDDVTWSDLFVELDIAGLYFIAAQQLRRRSVGSLRESARHRHSLAQRYAGLIGTRPRAADLTVHKKWSVLHDVHRHGRIDQIGSFQTLGNELLQLSHRQPFRHHFAQERVIDRARITQARAHR